MPAALGVENVITRQDLKVFPKEVADVVMKLVNQFGVRYKMPDGNHLWLMAEDTKVRPYKLAAKRPAQPTMLYLARWIVANVPNYYDDKTEQEIRDLTPEIEEAEQAERVNGHVATDAPGKPLVYSTGRTSVCFVWNANDEHKYVQCTMCDYSQESVRGAHLHEAKHTGRSAEVQVLATVARNRNREAKKAAEQAEFELATNAVGLLMQFFGLDGEAEEVERLRNLLTQQGEDLEAMRRERDDLATKLSMLREVMSA